MVTLQKTFNVLPVTFLCPNRIYFGFIPTWNNKEAESPLWEIYVDIGVL